MCLTNPARVKPCGIAAVIGNVAGLVSGYARTSVACSNGITISYARLSMATAAGTSDRRIPLGNAIRVAIIVIGVGGSDTSTRELHHQAMPTAIATARNARIGSGQRNTASP